MKTLKLENGDLGFDGQNNLRMVEGIDEKKQAIHLLLSTNAGEWFLNTLHGLDYTQILGEKPEEEQTRAAFLEAFEQEPRIEEMLQFNTDFANRRLTVNFNVRVEGEVIEGQEVF